MSEEKVNKSIYALQAEYIALVDQLEENGGELTEGLEELYIQNQEDFKKKVASYVGIIREKESYLDLIDDEAKRIADRKKAVKKTVDRLKQTLLDALMVYGQADKLGVFRFKEGLVELATRKSNKCTIIAEEELVMALKRKMFSVKNSEEALSIAIEADNAELELDFELVDPAVTKVEFEGEEPVAQEEVFHPNALEMDFLQNHLTYDAKFAIKYSDMVKVVSFLVNDLHYPQSFVDVDIKIPVKDASAIVKSNAGFRIARNDTNYGLTIK